MSTHAKYSPSKLPRIIKCPGSVGLTQELKDQGLIPTKDSSSAAAEEGTMLHAVMEEALTSKCLQVTDDQISKYGLTDEHIEACNECLDYTQVLKMSIPENRKHVELIEAKVTLGGYALESKCTELLDVYGTADYVLMFHDQLVILDWKFGKGIEVFPDSDQLKAYALAALSLYDKWAYPLSSLNNNLSISIIVGQPRISGEHFKSIEVTREDLKQWLSDQLVPSLLSISSKDPIFKPGEKTCMWCPVKHVPYACKTRLDFVKEVTSKAFQAFAVDEYSDSLNEALELFKKKPVVDKFFKDLMLYVTYRIKQGKKVPGFKIVQGRSTRAFKDLDENGLPAAFLSWAEETFNRDLTDFIISKPMSAPQAEKLLTKQVLKNHPAFYDFIHKPEGKHTLVPEDDKREALDFETTIDAFSSYVKKD